ncbi:MAG: tRNA 4-thiouridine(8) synthase ThiI [Lachnospiraceae bacterium]|nr:tRNA 4-thiouridine(8) synthase ThiI [Lachnospiraceae bacterium]MBQ6197388.1 tRNA 4-thiouridine(8) synthase ThiI [Lachnospiraceae bacterium]
MDYQAFLIKYAEIGIKGKNRYIFEDKLVSRINSALKRIAGGFTVSKASGRIYAVASEPFDREEAVTELQTVFGISGICPVVQKEKMPPDELLKAAVDYFGKAHPGFAGSFKVLATRADKSYPLDSQEINYKVGEAVLAAFPETHVDVHEPDILFRIEIREKVNFYSETIPGPGGMPVGSAGKAMVLLSGGIDSPVAGWMMAKRGVTVEAVYFHAPPYTSERAKQKVVELAEIVSRYAGPIRLHVVNFTDVQMHIYQNAPHDELTIIMRRYMMRIAEALAGENGCQALVTGESIGQVASQTMQSLVCTNEVCELPVFRPLIAFDKKDIIALAEQIGTFETSILPYEDCCTIFVAKHPVTKPNLGIIKRSESGLVPEIDTLVKTAIETEECIVCAK